MIPDLKKRIDEFQQALLSKLPKETLASLASGIEELLRSRVDRDALRVGDRAPDFELPNALGKSVRLAQRLAQGPVVVSFYRGGW